MTATTPGEREALIRDGILALVRSADVPTGVRAGLLGELYMVRSQVDAHVVVETVLDAVLARLAPAVEWVTTVEELEALPTGTLVLAGGEVYEAIEPDPRVNSGKERWRCLHDAEAYRVWVAHDSHTVLWQEYGPDDKPRARVLYRPEEGGDS